jgi:hypothetical protein
VPKTPSEQGFPAETTMPLSRKHGDVNFEKEAWFLPCMQQQLDRSLNHQEVVMNGPTLYERTLVNLNELRQPQCKFVGQYFGNQFVDDMD